MSSKTLRRASMIVGETVSTPQKGVSKGDLSQRSSQHRVSRIGCQDGTSWLLPVQHFHRSSGASERLDARGKTGTFGCCCGGSFLHPLAFGLRLSRDPQQVVKMSLGVCVCVCVCVCGRARACCMQGNLFRLVKWDTN